MPKAPRPSRRAPPSAGPGKLDDAARRDAAQTQAAMRELLARRPRRFTYADEIDFVFRPDHEN
jgi:hypothetical protein